MNLARFNPPEAHFDYVQKDCTWAVFYQGIDQTIGNHFLVIVNDRTRSARVVGGL